MTEMQKHITKSCCLFLAPACLPAAAADLGSHTEALSLHTVMQALTDGVLWAMERSTFRTIVLAARVQKRRRYEEVLADVDIFQSLSPANRSSIADCLTAEVFEVI